MAAEKARSAENGDQGVGIGLQSHIAALNVRFSRLLCEIPQGF
jgi:hypothetical protein